MMHHISKLTADQLGYFMIITGIATFIASLVGPIAPYGRYSTSHGWGFLINAKLAWVTQEMWSFLVPVYWLLFKSTPSQLQRLTNNPQNTILLALFLIHYTNRDFIYPLRIRGGKPTPFTIWLLAAIFCLCNGYMQTLYLLTEAPLSQDDGGDSYYSTFTTTLSSPRFVIGVAIWLTGWLINLHSDNILIHLRKTRTKKGGYRIPRGGMFEYVSAANYFGEWVEWVGWAIASWSVPAAAFAFFTFANLAPRAVKHHEWYKRKFSRYPKGRKAFIPFVW